LPERQPWGLMCRGGERGEGGEDAVMHDDEKCTHVTAIPPQKSRMLNC
jgi:hypothetical protein